MSKHARLIAIVLIGSIAIGAAAFLLKKRTYQIPLAATFADDDYSKESLQVAADFLNRKSPAMIDSATRLDKTTVDTRTIIYHYTLIGQTRAGMDLDKVRKDLFDGVAKGTCERLSAPLDKGVQMRYHYKDKAGQPLFELMVDAAVCRQLAGSDAPHAARAAHPGALNDSLPHRAGAASGARSAAEGHGGRQGQHGGAGRAIDPLPGDGPGEQA